jgi:uncharacterized metal-binding protein YceD (DUF177 family)
MTPEFSRPVRAHEVGRTARIHQLTADDAERQALARRFGLIALERLTAGLSLQARDGHIALEGELQASGAQACVASGEPVPFTLAEPIRLKLVPASAPGTDLELAAEDLDLEPLEDDIIDLGEFAAQALGLALDPYPRSTTPVPGLLTEDQARAAASPFAALKGLPQR